jgi:membrane associated rhomboid family serine protease
MLDVVARGAEIVPSPEPGRINPVETTRHCGPVFNAPAIVVATIGLLAAIHLVLQLAGEGWQVWALYAFSFVPSRFQPNTIAMIEGSQYWSLITYAFLHADWMHIGLNSLWILIFGTPVARVLGTLRFMLIFLAGAVGGALVMLAIYWGESVVTVGASASASALIAAAIPIMYGNRWRGPLTIPELLGHRRAMIFMIICVTVMLLPGVQSGIDAWLVMLFPSVQSIPGIGDGLQIAWEAHLGGFASGLLAYALLLPQRRRLEPPPTG